MEDIPKRKSNTLVLVAQRPHEEFPIFARCSTLHKLTRIAAYCLRFISNISNKMSKVTGLISVEELHKANLCLMKLAQKESFGSNRNEINSSKQLKGLNPFFDDVGILRVGERLTYSNYSYGKKHLII
ncbi:hypothetical protein QE152_g8030 [Popillia japonica]|uniref:Uncharacterized protein n=1 Tax=Popillia japonica TaxID=7064 RepID=A0AAW1MD82_POPJA